MLELALSGSWQKGQLDDARHEAAQGRMRAAEAQINISLGVADKIWGEWSPESILTLTCWAAIQRDFGLQLGQGVAKVELDRRLELLFRYLLVDESILRDRARI